jgi:hypothetical protein
MYTSPEVKKDSSIRRLTSGITTVNDDISTSDVRAGIAGKENISTLQLLGLSIAAHWDHSMPNILNILAHKVGKTSVDVTRRDGVDAGKIPPFVGKRAGQVDTACFGNIVGCLDGKIS